MRLCSAVLCATVVLAGIVAPSRAVADLVVLEPARDTTLIENSDGLLSNGASDFICVGNTNQGSSMNTRRGLIAFDVATEVPAGSVIDSVTLRLHMSQTMTGAQTVSLRRATQEWGEGTSNSFGCQGTVATIDDATWLYRFYIPIDPTVSPAWSNPGGDFAVSSAASAVVGGVGNYTWSSATMTSQVQAWLDDPFSNFGWGILGNESSSSTAKRFDSRSISTVGFRPTLEIEFTPPVFTEGACCFSDDTCAVLTPTECSTQGGTFSGLGTDCTPNPCVGSCCFEDGTCSTLSSSECASLGGSYGGDGTVCEPDLCPVVLTPYLDPLPIPAVAVPTSGTAGGAASYTMAITEFQQQLHSELPPTTVWGYDGSYPGPTIEASRDELVTVNWINDLRDEFGALRTEHYLPVDLCMHGPGHLGASARTVVHLHGGHIPAEFDGDPEATQLPGESAVYEYPNHQLPATLWYHDHALGITRLNVMMGLAGFYLIRDQEELDLGLPDGEHEIPLVIQDRSFRCDGTFAYPEEWQEHFFGDKNLVNGKVWPYLEVDQGKYRFRVLNGANSRTYDLCLSTGDAFSLIGTDGGLRTAPLPLTQIVLAPAERADIVIDFSGYPVGTEIVLQNSAPAPYAPAPYPGTPGSGVIPDVMKFIVTGAPGHTDPIPVPLRFLDVLDEADAVLEREFVIQRFIEPCAGTRWLINELAWDDITEYPVLGTTEVWKFINRSGMTHPMHMHLVMFQVLDRQPFEVDSSGQFSPSGPAVAPPLVERGWKDTVRVDRFEMVRVIASFEDYTGLFPYHCHVLEHEDHEMMRQFEVVPGPSFVRGDCNDDDTVDISDAIFELIALFATGAVVTCFDACDANDDGGVDIVDPVFTLAFSFAGGAAPPAPYPNCGPDPTADAMGCDLFNNCP